MTSEVFITCAVVGAGEAVEHRPHVTAVPEQIADSAIEAPLEQAAVVHIHVGDHKTRPGTRNPALHREVVRRIRGSDLDPEINLTRRLGGDVVLGGPEFPQFADARRTDMAGALVREKLALKVHL
ncbi:3-keto-5-aminohexanoate cleavage protein [Bradyrhizobium sp. 23AC]